MDNGISVIIITMNRCEELCKTIELLKKQECKYPFEIVIVDQASNDETFQTVGNIAEPFRYIRLEKNYGVSGGRNKGAALAKYSYMVFLDDDAHFVDNSSLEKIYEKMEASSYNLFAFKIMNIEKGLYNWPYSKQLINCVDKEFIAGTFIGCGHAIKKDFFEKVGGYSNALFFWGEESELVMKSVGYDGRAVSYSGSIQIVHRVSGNGRNTYDANRFYYQVRNRMYLYNELVPRSMFGYKYYYLIGYWVKAHRNGWIKEFYKGVQDSRNMPIEYTKKLTVKEFIDYESVFHRRK